MGIGDLLYSVKDKFKQNAPDLTSVTNGCQSSYRASGAVASSICKFVTVEGMGKVKDYLPNSHTLKRIGKEVAVPELLRFTGIPGLVQSYRIYQEVFLPASIHDIKKVEHQSKEMKKIQEKYEELREEVENIKQDNMILRERMKGLEYRNDSFHLQPEEIQKPDEVIMDFVGNGFYGRPPLCNLVVRNAGYFRKP